ncbi:MAG TPA: ATP-binding protein [Polyangiaceae bacterium]
MGGDNARTAKPEDWGRALSVALLSFGEATADYERLLDVIARTLAAVVKDGCVVRLLGEEGWLTPVAIHLPLENRGLSTETRIAMRAHMAAPHHVSEHEGARRVLETGEPLLIAKLDLESLRGRVDPEILMGYQTIGIHSLLLVALRAKGESVGTLSLARFEPGSPAFTERDRDLARTLAEHAALAILNARQLRAALRELAAREGVAASIARTDEEVRHAQKMEAVGRLAGGVAHDFNNLLSVILSYAEIIGAEMRVEDPLRADLEEIKRAGVRASELTRQLLAFSRQQVLEVTVLNFNESLAGVEKMLRRLLGADVALTTLPASGLWNIKADGAQVEQVLMNLAVNARDAMPQGGQLTIETCNVELDEASAREHHGVAPGSYVLLSVSDTGVGMDRETQARVFEPFFTTKERGKGTGLGLATVFGIVKQSGGHIGVESEPGKGTTFKVLFPRTRGAAAMPTVEQVQVDLGGGSETILLVEDDDQVRVLARAILRRNGYLVLEAPNGGEALLICEQHESRIHLLLTDLVLPRMSGRQLAERLVAQRPTMKVLFMSGYTDDAVLQHRELDQGTAYLQKPLTPSALTRKVRDVLRAG